MEEIEVLSIYKLNVYKVLTFMLKTKRDTVLTVFREISHRYPTGFSERNFVEDNILSN